MKKKNKLICGVGINDADYRVKEMISFLDENGKKKQKCLWTCPLYQKWISMLKRCYSEKYQEQNPTYKGCSVCEEWLTFSNFKGWMEQQDWEGKSLDKDILYPGNKLYSPETCVFVDAKVNTFLIESNAGRGKHMIGASWDRQYEKFLAQCNDGAGKIKKLGRFDTELEAHKAWLDFKLKLAYQLALEQPDKRVAKALIDRYENYEVR